MTRITIGGLALSPDVAERLEMVGMRSFEVKCDIEAIRNGHTTREKLLEHCLNGSDEHGEAEWLEYVDAVCDAAEKG